MSDTQMRQIEREMATGDYTQLERYHHLLVRRHAIETEYVIFEWHMRNNKNSRTMKILLEKIQRHAYRTDPADGGLNSVSYIDYCYAFCGYCGTELEQGSCPNGALTDPYRNANGVIRRCTVGLQRKADKLRNSYFWLLERR